MWKFGIDFELAAHRLQVRPQCRDIHVRAAFEFGNPPPKEDWTDIFVSDAEYEAKKADGIYEALPILVDAVQVPFAFVVRTREGGDLLQGIPGDWLVDYGDGSLGIVGEAIFRDSYEVLEQ